MANAIGTKKVTGVGSSVGRSDATPSVAIGRI